MITQQDGHVFISEVHIKKDAVGQFTSYQIQFKDQQVERRYRDFYQFYQVLRSQYPGVYIPPIPQKQVVGILEDNFIRQRRRLLQSFLDALQTRHYLWNGPEVAFFLDPQQIYDVVPTYTTEKLLEKYLGIFPEYAHQVVNYEMKFMIREFQNQMGNIKPMMENFKKMCENFLQSRKQYQVDYQLFLNSVIPEYERQLITGDSKHPFFQSQQKFESKKTFQYDYDQFLIDIYSQELEVGSYLACFDSIKQLENKKDKLDEKNREAQLDLQATLSSRRNFLAKMFYGSKDKEVLRLQSLIQSVGNESQQLQQIIDMLYINLGRNEIPHYKKEKQHAYLKLLKIFATLELDQAAQITHYWEDILHNQYIQQIELNRSSISTDQNLRPQNFQNLDTSTVTFHKQVASIYSQEHTQDINYQPEKVEIKQDDHHSQNENQIEQPQKYQQPIREVPKIEILQVSVIQGLEAPVKQPESESEENLDNIGESIGHVEEQVIPSELSLQVMQ